jgi:hypothetical protein
MDKKHPYEREDLRTFIDTGLLWFVNRLLHMFGYALCYDEDEAGNLSELYVSRTIFRGFEPDAENEGYAQVAQFLRDKAAELYEQADYGAEG